MNRDPKSKLPLPVEVLGFAFLASPAAPTHTVLEFQTAENPVRIFLSKVQAEALAAKAKIAASKIQS
ncbi:MAG: hypothetical protein ABSC72_02260 [Methylovirgula sp.]|jgi:hypothetical protein